jgi:hypothetical protein
MTNDQRLPFVASTTRMGWPTQACFWLEWGCSDLPNSVIPTGADHRESDDLRGGGTLCCDVNRR